MDSRKGYRASVLIALFLGIIAASFTGDMSPIGYSSECTDGIDNDGDNLSHSIFRGGIDASDGSCFDYPFSDGNGETDTPMSDRYNSLQSYPSLFAFHRDHGGFVQVCDAYGGGYYDQLPEQKAEADTWLNSQGSPRILCPP